MDKLYALIQKTPVGHKVAVLGFVVALAAAAHYFLIYQSQDESLVALDKKYSKLEEELQEKQEIANNITKFKKRVEYLQQKLEEKKKNLPDDANMDVLLKTLNELSEKSDMKIIKFTPKPEVRQNFYAEIPVQMQIEGNYHEIATFFDKVAKEDRIINITDINLSEPKIRNGKVILTASCLAKTFRTLMPGEDEASAKGKKAPPPKKGAKPQPAAGTK